MTNWKRRFRYWLWHTSCNADSNSDSLSSPFFKPVSLNNSNNCEKFLFLRGARYFIPAQWQLFLFFSPSTMAAGSFFFSFFLSSSFQVGPSSMKSLQSQYNFKCCRSVFSAYSIGTRRGKRDGHNRIIKAKDAPMVVSHSNGPQDFTIHLVLVSFFFLLLWIPTLVLTTAPFFLFFKFTANPNDFLARRV